MYLHIHGIKIQIYCSIMNQATTLYIIILYAQAEFLQEMEKNLNLQKKQMKEKKIIWGHFPIKEIITI